MRNVNPVFNKLKSCSGKLLSLTSAAMKATVVCAVIGLMASSANAVVLDDFSGNLNDFTGTVILDANGGGSNTSTWEVSSGQLRLNTTVYDGIEQHAFIYDGASLLIGQELRADFVNPIAGSRNFGLYVGGKTPATGVREDYISVYGGSDGANNKIFTRGFDGTTEYNNLFGPTGPAYDKLFIARTAENTFDVGYYEGATRTVITTRTPVTPNSADFLGFYADVRAAGNIEFADNLEIFPDVVFDPADVNEDGDIDEDDYFIIRDNLFETDISGTPVAKGDGDIVPNGIVDLADFRFWKDSASPAALIAAGIVPEPSSLMLCLLGSVLVTRQRSRR